MTKNPSTQYNIELQKVYDITDEENGNSTAKSFVRVYGSMIDKDAKEIAVEFEDYSG